MVVPAAVVVVILAAAAWSWRTLVAGGPDRRTPKASLVSKSTGTGAGCCLPGRIRGLNQLRGCRV
jgi:hypothetical protein